MPNDERRISDVYRDYLAGDLSFERLIGESERRIAAAAIDRPSRQRPDAREQPRPAS